jgi:hypothetical protein
MTLFRYKKNGLLYTIEHVTPSRMTGHWYEAIPFRHTVAIGLRGGNRFKSNMSLNDFVEVATA